MKNSVTAIILSGGKGTRLGGTEKGLISLDGQALVARKIEQLKVFDIPILLVTNEPDQYAKFEVEMVSDIVSGIGPMGGILTGLTYSQTPLNFFAAVDMPYFSEPLFGRLLATSLAEPSLVTVFEHSSGIEPLFAIYNKDCIPKLKIFIENKNYRLTEFIEDQSGNKIQLNTEEATTLFYNINTPQHLKEIENIASPPTLRVTPSRASGEGEYSRQESPFSASGERMSRSDRREAASHAS